MVKKYENLKFSSKSGILTPNLNFWRFQLNQLHNLYKPALWKCQNPAHSRSQKTQEGIRICVFQGNRKWWQSFPLCECEGALAARKWEVTRGTGSSGAAEPSDAIPGICSPSHWQICSTLNMYMEQNQAQDICRADVQRPSYTTASQSINCLHLPSGTHPVLQQDCKTGHGRILY